MHFTVPPQHLTVCLLAICDCRLPWVLYHCIWVWIQDVQSSIFTAIINSDHTSLKLPCPAGSIEWAVMYSGYLQEGSALTAAHVMSQSTTVGCEVQHMTWVVQAWRYEEPSKQSTITVASYNTPGDNICILHPIEKPHVQMPPKCFTGPNTPH